MKKKFVKALSLILVFSLLLSVFALSACTDKTRTLNDVEKSIVGKWQDPTLTSYICTYNNDGSWEDTNNHNGEFKQESEVTDEHGHYYIISIGKNYGDSFAWFENDPDNLYSLNSWNVSLTRITDDE